MARTTLAIDDDLLRRLKQKAAAEGKTLQEVANALLRQSLARAARTGAYRLELQGWDAQLQPGVDILDRDRLLDILDEP